MINDKVYWSQILRTPQESSGDFEANFNGGGALIVGGAKT